MLHKEATHTSRYLRRNMTTAGAVSLDSLKVRRFGVSDYDAIVELISHENWFILEKSKLEKIVEELDPDFYVLEDQGASGQVIGTLAICKTRDGETILTDVIVRDGYRGRGFGRFMVENVLKFYSEVIVTLFATVDAFYMKLGFTPCEQTALFVAMTVDRDKLETYCQENALEDGTNIVTFTEDRKQDVITYDAGARGYSAEKGFSLTMATSNYLAMAVKGKDEKIVGYMGSCLEPAGSLNANGLYADDRTIAAHLLRRTLNYFPAVERFRMNTLEKRQFLMEFGHLKEVSRFNRLSYGGEPAKIPEEKLYAFNQPDLCY